MFLQYVIQKGEQEDGVIYDQIIGGKGFCIVESMIENYCSFIYLVV